MTNHKSHRQGYLQIYQYIGLAKIPKTELQTLIEIPNTDLKQLTCFLRYIEEILKDLAPGKGQAIGFQTPVPICHRSLRYLKNRNGTYLENQFSFQLKRYFSPSLLESERTVKRLLFHVRLGDVANLELLPGKILIPWCFAHEDEGFIEIAHQLSHYRNDHLLDFSALVKSLRSKLGHQIEINVISDGFDTSFEYILDRQKILDYIASYGLRFDESKVKALKTRYRDDFHKSFEKADTITYGEGANAVMRAIDLIINSDVIVSSSGHFALGVMNNLGNRAQTFLSPKIIYLTAQRKNSRQNVTTQILSDSAAENLKKIMQALEHSVD